MTNTTDGKEIVWAVFNADGCECEDFLGVFGSEEAATKVADELRLLIRSFYVEELEVEWQGIISVRPVVIGEYRTPADAVYMQEKAGGPAPENGAESEGHNDAG